MAGEWQHDHAGRASTDRPDRRRHSRARTTSRDGLTLSRDRDSVDGRTHSTDDGDSIDGQPTPRNEVTPYQLHEGDVILAMVPSVDRSGPEVCLCACLRFAGPPCSASGADSAGPNGLIPVS